MRVTVCWFDKKSGTGWVRAGDGSSAPIYACNIKGKRTWYAETACVYYSDGQEVEIEQDENGFVIGVTPGTLDQDKWNSLDQARLAFRCDDTGKAVNGLFSKE